MTTRIYEDILPGFRLEITHGSYDLICKTDGATAVRRVGRFTCPICGSNVPVSAVKCVVFGLLYGGGMPIRGAITGRTVTPEPNMLEFERPLSLLRKKGKAFNFAIQANFAELEARALVLYGKVASAAAELPNHEEGLSEKDDYAGRDHCSGSCLCKSKPGDCKH